MLKKELRSFYSFVSIYLVAMFCPGIGWMQEMPPFKNGTDTADINQMIKKGRAYPDPDSAIAVFKVAAQKSIEGNFYLGAADALCGAGAKWVDKAKYQEGFNSCKEALVFAEKSRNYSRIARCHNCFGAIYMVQGNCVMATEEYLKALDEFKKNNATKTGDLVNVYNNLALLYRQIGQLDKNWYYLNLAETTIRNANIPATSAKIYLSDVLLNKGAYYLDRQELDSAIKYYNNALVIADSLDEKKTASKYGILLIANLDLGIVYIKKGEYRKAVAYLQPIVSNSTDRNENTVVAAHSALGNALFHLKKYQAAEEVILAGLHQHSISHATTEAIESYSYLVELYKATGQYKKALDCMDSLEAIKDTLVTAEKVKTIQQVQSKYDMAEKDRQITKNELLIAQQKNKIAVENIWIGSISAGVMLLSLLSFGIYRNSRLKQAGVITSLRQENTISILKGVVQGEENERIRLARDLHDGIGGMLSATKMRFMALTHDNEELINSPKYLDAMGLLDIMGDEIRKTSHNLMPEVLMKQNLADALGTYCNNIQAGSDLKIDFQSFGNFENLPNDFKLNIYRIVQELLKNTLQHAQATYAVVQLMMLEAYLTVSIEDNGVGFNTNETKDGIGLHNLKTRVLSLNGHYTLKSEPGKGTTVYIEFGRPADGG